MGARRMALEGDITVTHEMSGLVGKLTFQTKNRKLDKVKKFYFVVEGWVKDKGQGKALATIKGETAGDVRISFPKKAAIELPFIEGDVFLKGSDISSPLPLVEDVPEDEDLKSRFTSVVWGKTIAALKAQNYELADEEKKVVEEAERAARLAAEEAGDDAPKFEPKLFKQKSEADAYVWELIEQ
mmetsp:Transcript_8064/g.33946  ORF Transcript_8064/g.33946 Transcript_8064/m.33946 type:complete len:184 (-) Transcript_8064:40-591(-)